MSGYISKSILIWYAKNTKAAINIPPTIVILKSPEIISVFEGDHGGCWLNRKSSAVSVILETMGD